MRALCAAVLLCVLATVGRAADADDALAARDAGRLEDARAAWVKASGAEDADGFVWAQRGWSELAVGKSKDARASFARAVDRADGAAAQAEARLGDGLALMLFGKMRDADEPLRLAGLAGPYEIAASSRLRAEAALAVGDSQAARTHLRQALEIDAYDLVSLRRLMFLLAREDSPADAWRAADRVLRMDPSDAEARQVRESSARGLKSDRDAALGLRRAMRPLLNPDDDSTPLPASTRTIRVGLYASDAGRPSELTSCVLVPNADYAVLASTGDAARAAGSAGEPRRLEFDPATRRVDVRDLGRNLLFSTRAPLRFAPRSPRGSVLISAAATFSADSDVDRGDRELRGTIAVYPGAGGFTLVDESALEAYLYGVVSSALPDGAPDAALEAQAVIARTAAARAAARAAAGAVFDVVDSGELRTIGVSGELRAATAAVGATDGVVLEKGGEPIDAPQNADSGGWTEGGIADGAYTGARPTAGLALERFLHDPPAGLFSAASPAAAPSATRWTLVLDERDLRGRASRRADVGRLLSVRVAARAATGRVEELDVVGTKGALTLKGRDAIESFLSPGSLRSTLFSLQPLNDGAKLKRLLVWGAGTGDGRGFPRAGALGQAAAGADWRAILARYFPDAALTPESRKK
jgi:stage II sporulation protein D